MINDYPIYTYGLGDRINSRLHDVIIDNIKDPSVREVERIVGRRTGWTFHKTEVKEVQLMVHWINQLIPQICQHFIRNPQRKDDIQDPGFNPYWLKIVEMWGLHYKKNESLNIHNHFPFTLSFCYAVRCPRGSSPLVVDNKRFYLKESQMVVFPADRYHYVPPNRSEERTVLVGNLLYCPPLADF